MKKIVHYLWIFILSMSVYAQTPIHQFNFDGNVTNTASTVTLTTNAISYGNDRNGQANKSLYMGATSTSQASANLTNIPLGNSPRTISIWYRADSSSSISNPLFSYGTDTFNNAIMLTVNFDASNRMLLAEFGGVGNNTNAILSGTFNANIWHQYAITYTGTYIKMYLDGALVNTMLLPSINTIGTQFNVGNRISTNDLSAGWYDDLQIYNTALTDAQVNQLYTNNSIVTVTPPTISSVSTSNITSNAATINYAINANGANATTIIRYGTSSGSLNQTYNCPSTSTTASFFETISGLSPSTTYYYRIESSNTAGTTITPTTYTFTTTSTASSITNGLVAYYGFENFNSHNGLHNLTPSASAPILDGIGGKVGLGARFESANSQQLVNSSSLNTALDGTEFTICYWVNSQANTSGQTFPTQFEMFGSGFARQQQSFGYAFLHKGYATNATTFNTAATSVTDINGTWKHIAIVHKSGTTNNKEFELYVDGVLQGGFAPIANVPVLHKFNSNFYIGGGGAANKYFKGYMDEFYIYNRALDATEINTVKDNTNAPLSASSFNNNLKFNLYPNPANDVVSISLDNELKSVEVYSLQGQKVLVTTDKEFNVSQLNSGVYLVKVEDVNGNVSTQKLIKK